MFFQIDRHQKDLARMIMRSTFVCLLACAVLFPKVSAVFFDMMPSIQTMVICTGDRLIVMRFDSNGVPIEDPETFVEHCLVADQLEGTPQTAPAWHAFARSYRHPFTRKLNAAADMDRLRAKHPSRAPPVLT